MKCWSAETAWVRLMPAVSLAQISRDPCAAPSPFNRRGSEAPSSARPALPGGGPTSSVDVDRELRRQRVDLLLHRGFRRGVAFLALGGEAIQHLDDHAADLFELRRAEAARGCGGRAETDAGGHEGLFRIEGNAVLVAGDVGAAERGFRRLAG